MIRLVTFDLDGTLYDNSLYMPALLRRWLRPRLFTQSPLQTLREIRTAHSYQKAREGSRKLGPVSGLRETVLIQTAARTGYRLGFVRKVIDELIYENSFEGADLHVFPGVRETLRALKNLGLQLAVLSDYPVDKKLAALGLGSIGFDLLLSSEDVDALKPHPALFTEACNRLGVEPALALHVGDRLDCDVAGAHAAGMKTLHFRPRRPHREGPRADFEASDFAAIRLIVETLAKP